MSFSSALSATVSGVRRPRHVEKLLFLVRFPRVPDDLSLLAPLQALPSRHDTPPPKTTKRGRTPRSCTMLDPVRSFPLNTLSEVSYSLSTMMRRFTRSTFTPPSFTGTSSTRSPRESTLSIATIVLLSNDTNRSPPYSGTRGGTRTHTRRLWRPLLNQLSFSRIFVASPGSKPDEGLSPLAIYSHLLPDSLYNISYEMSGKGCPVFPGWVLFCWDASGGWGASSIGAAVRGRPFFRLPPYLAGGRGGIPTYIDVSASPCPRPALAYRQRPHACQIPVRYAVTRWGATACDCLYSKRTPLPYIIVTMSCAYYLYICTVT